MARLTVEGRDHHARLFFEGLAMLLEGQVVVELQLGGQPLLECRSLEAGTPGDRPWLYVSGFAAPLKPAFDGRNRYREGPCDFFPWHSAVYGGQHPES